MACVLRAGGRACTLGQTAALPGDHAPGGPALLPHSRRHIASLQRDTVWPLHCMATSSCHGGVAILYRDCTARERYDARCLCDARALRRLGCDESDRETFHWCRCWGSDPQCSQRTVHACRGQLVAASLLVWGAAPETACGWGVTPPCRVAQACVNSAPKNMGYTQHPYRIYRQRITRIIRWSLARVFFACNTPEYTDLCK